MTRRWTTRAMVATLGVVVMSLGCGMLTPAEDVSYDLCLPREDGHGADSMYVTGMQVGYTLGVEVWRERQLLTNSACFSGGAIDDLSARSSAPSVLRVEREGQQLVLRALAPGEADVIVEADGRRAITRRVTVAEADLLVPRELDGEEEGEAVWTTPQRALSGSLVTISFELVNAAAPRVALSGPLAPEDWTVEPPSAATIVTARPRRPHEGRQTMVLRVDGAAGEAFTLTHRLGLAMTWTIAPDDALGELAPRLPYLPMAGTPYVDRLTSTGGESTIASSLRVRMVDVDGAPLRGQPVEGVTLRLEGHDPDTLRLERRPSWLGVEALDVFDLVGAAPGEGTLIIEARGARRELPLQIKPAI